MATICPTITAFDTHQYRAQMERLEPFAQRLHIDLMDGDFAPTVSQSLEQTWLPENILADIHLMYRRPAEQLEQLINLKPNLVIIHAEAAVDHQGFADDLQQSGIKAGLAILSATPIESWLPAIKHFDHVLIFSGDLGKHGGVADLTLLDKVQSVRSTYPDKEIGWDGGINDRTIEQLVEAGVTILNVGGFIHSAENAGAAYSRLQQLV